MKITYDWLKDHLQTKNSENQLLEKLTDIGLEVEGIENTYSDLDKFIVSKIVRTEKHPNADRLKVCDVNIGKKNFTAYTMDYTKKYIEINADYRS